MFRKTISIVLCIILILCMSVPAFATPNEIEPAEAKTVEEILNDYHEKSFLIQRMAETDAPAAYSRQGEALRKTLEEETVDELAAAGYEAYNVTSENYGDLEVALMTNFSELGLDPNGSYIVVLSGENHSSQVNPNSRSGIPPEESLEGGDGGSSYFGYQYNGSIYYLRHIVVTETTGSFMTESSMTRLGSDCWFFDLIHDIGCALLVAGADKATAPVPLGTILSLLGGQLDTGNYTLLEDEELVCMANTTWICNAIQIWDGYEEIWDTSQASASAESQAYFTGFLYNEDTGRSERFDGETYGHTFYSPYYYSYTIRYDKAVEYYLMGRFFYDYTGDIEFFLTDKDYEIVYTSSNTPFFTHVEEWEVPDYSVT